MGCREVSFTQLFHRTASIMKSTKVQTLRHNLTEMLHALGEQTGMKLSCIKPMSKVRGLSIEPHSSIGCITQIDYYDGDMVHNHWVWL